jgi:hypothetical protein
MAGSGANISTTLLLASLPCCRLAPHSFSLLSTLPLIPAEILEICVSTLCRVAIRNCVVVMLRFQVPRLNSIATFMHTFNHFSVCKPKRHHLPAQYPALHWRRFIVLACVTRRPWTALLHPHGPVHVLAFLHTCALAVLSVLLMSLHGSNEYIPWQRYFLVNTLELLFQDAYV